MKTNKGIKLFAPACISMLSYGLRDVSIAIEKPGNEIIAKTNGDNRGVNIVSFSKEKEDENGVKAAVLKIANSFMSTVNAGVGVDLEIFNRIPFYSGLGALEANITGTISALNDILNAHFENQELFDFIINETKINNIDVLPSSIAANIFGGIILFNENLHHPIQKLYAPHGLNLTLIEKRNKIDKEIFENISSQELFDQSRNNAGFIKSLFTTEHDLLSKCLRYNVFDEKIGSNIDWYFDIKKISYDNEVYSIGFSHFGETVFIINPNTLIRDENNKAMTQYFSKNKIKVKLINTVINLNGIFKY